MKAIKTIKTTKTVYYITDECDLIIEKKCSEHINYDYVIDKVHKVHMLWQSDLNMKDTNDYKLEISVFPIGINYVSAYVELSRDNEDACDGWECIANSTSVNNARDMIQASIEELVHLFRDWDNIPYRLRWMSDKFVEIALKYPEIF